MPTPTTAAVARVGEDTFCWERVVLDDPRADEVLVRLVATGLCHTDLSVLAGRLPTPLPAVLGHEGAGVVEAVGADVVGVVPGDKVVLSFNSCRQGTVRPLPYRSPPGAARTSPATSVPRVPTVPPPSTPRTDRRSAVSSSASPPWHGTRSSPPRASYASTPPMTRSCPGSHRSAAASRRGPAPS
ncbi:alcohol dehydrogenase catalytic domain-containing protein [Streptomyces sp. NPDC056987]|uniref:alcohol dehydrogenase catalytic domain-containing protein n=1 Tax=Streptomyces sp. NPDC056987 TaxID=3345988 RepID=UPI00362C7489